MKVSGQAYLRELEWDNRRTRKRPFGFRQRALGIVSF